MLVFSVEKKRNENYFPNALICILVVLYVLK